MIQQKLLVFSLLALLAAVGCGGGSAPEGETAEAPGAQEQPAEVFEVDPATAATISGKVFFDGEPPQPQRLTIGDEECKEMHDGPIMSEQIVVNDGMLANVLVRVKSGLEGKTFPTRSGKVTIDQDGCVYKPHVVALQVGQTLSVTNSDATLHNVHPLPRDNAEWNKSQAAGAGAIEETFSEPELMIPVKCNIHPWMRAYVNVIEHPFFDVTREGGMFEIKGLPPGTYVIQGVHERLGEQEIEVTVGEGESKTVELHFAG